MRSIQKLAVAGGVALAVGLAMAMNGAPRISQDQPAGNRIAVVDIFGLAERIMQVPEYAAARDAIAQKWTTQIESAQQEVERIRTEFQTLAQDDPKRQALSAEVQGHFAAMQEAEQRGTAEIQQLSTQQLIDAYDRALAATQAVADRDGYTHVIVSRSRDRAIDPDNINVAIQEMLARPIVVYPDGDEITARVMAELKLPEAAPALEPEAGAEAEDPPAAAEPAAPAPR